MMVKGAAEDFFAKIPVLKDSLKDKYADAALEFAMIEAKDYPPQMQDLVINRKVLELLVQPLRNGYGCSLWKQNI